MHSRISFTFRTAPELLERVHLEAERQSASALKMMALVEAALAARGSSKRMARNTAAGR